MRTECTCGVVLIDDPAPDGLVSHGLCAACYREQMRALLAGYTSAMLVRELATATEEVATALRRVCAAGTVAELNDAEGSLAEAKSWLIEVELECEERRIPT